MMGMDMQGEITQIVLASLLNMSHFTSGKNTACIISDMCSEKIRKIWVFQKENTFFCLRVYFKLKSNSKPLYNQNIYTELYLVNKI